MNKYGVVIHCSDSTFGSSIEIDKWHRENGWKDIGYHFVICNGQVENNNYLACMDGAIERGRDLDEAGAHAQGCNSTHIGICLIGVNKFTDKQFNSLAVLLKELKAQYGIKDENIIGHYAVSPKTCPNFSVEEYKAKYL